MQIRYTVKKRDILFARMSFMVRNRVLLVFSILIVCFLTWMTMSGTQGPKMNILARIIADIIVFTIFAALYIGFQVVVNGIMILFSKHRGVEGLHLLEIKDEGMEESTEVNKSLHRWNPSFRVQEFGNYILIFPTDGVFFIIPKRRGAYEGDLASFCHLLKSKIGQH